jgi:hypothetical protein
MLCTQFECICTIASIASSSPSMPVQPLSFSRQFHQRDSSAKTGVMADPITIVVAATQASLEMAPTVLFG